MTRPIPPAAAFGLDALLIIVFAAIGRRSHDESSALLGVLTTAWPFLVGTAVGWLAAYGVRRAAPVSVRDGILVWLATVVVGMLLRVATGSGTAPAFLAVATVTTGVLLLGWRAVPQIRSLVTGASATSR